jgi:D-arabinose 5-phosphate isomerase GutQ
MPEANAPSMVLHPTSLESGVLSAIGKNDELLVPVWSGIYHRLRQNVYV